MVYPGILVLVVVFETANSLPLHKLQHSIFLNRLKRGAPTGNAFDPPIPVFPAKENAPFWMPPPYPIPATAVPPPVSRRRLPYYDPNNPYLDAMTDGYWPNFGLGYVNHNPTLVGGGLNWPTGNVLMPSDHFNGTFGVDTPRQLRLGMQGGPFFPYQNPKYITTIKDINDANMLQQAAQVQEDARQLPSMNSVQGIPNGFLPVQQQFFSRSQQMLMSPRGPHRQLSFASVPNH